MTTTTEQTWLTDHFLIAMPQLADGYFAGSVVYLWQHSREGALGLVVNLPTNMQLCDILEQLNIEDLRGPDANQTVLSGGPVETEKGFILHDAPPRWPSSLRITDEITLTTSRDILVSIGRGEGPKNYLMTLGCSGWSAGQLEKELAQNSWFTCPASKDILFSTEFANKANMAAAKLGFSMAQLTTDVGYSWTSPEICLQTSSPLTLFGIDYGTRKIGVAVGQNVTNTAMGIAVIPVRNGEPDWIEFDKLVQRWKPGAFVVGMPFNMDGSESEMTVQASKLARILTERYKRPCHPVDERLSTRAAREITRNNAEMLGKRYDDKTKVDAMAAQLLLESWFAEQ